MYTMMKFYILLILSILVITEASVLKAPSNRANLQLGDISLGDRLLHRTYISKEAISNTIQNDDLIYRGSTTTKISGISAIEVGGTQQATAWVTAGGIGANNVTIRFQSEKGRGYYFLVDIWER